MRRGLKNRILVKAKIPGWSEEGSEEGEGEILRVAGKPGEFRNKRKDGQLSQMLLRSGKIKVKK